MAVLCVFAILAVLAVLAVLLAVFAVLPVLHVLHVLEVLAVMAVLAYWLHWVILLYRLNCCIGLIGCIFVSHTLCFSNILVFVLGHCNDMLSEQNNCMTRKGKREAGTIEGGGEN